MAEKGATKGGRRAKIDEDNDVFLSFINKRKRNNKKKLTEIEELEKRDPSTLKPEQLTKIKSRADISKQNAYWHEIKDLYYQALKTNQEEGGKKNVVQKETAKEQEKAPVKEETQKVSKEEKPKADAVRPIVALIHVNEFFSNATTREEFDKGYMNMSGSLGLSTFPDFKALHDFSHKVFRTCGTATTSSGDCLDKAVTQLQKYVDGADEKASGDKTYAYFNDVVSKLVASEFFRGHKAHHDEHKKTEHKHVGEHKHTTEHEHKHEPKKHESPKKTHHEEPKKTHHEEPKKTHHHEEPKKVHHEEPKKPHHDEVKKVHHDEGKKVHHEEPKKTHHHEEPKKHHEEPKKTHHEEPKKVDSPTKVSKKEHHHEETRAPQENTEDWDKFEDDEEEEEEETKKYVPKKDTEKADDGFVEVTAKYLDKKKTENGGRGERRGGGRRGGGRGERRGGGGYRGGENRGEYKGGENRGGDSRGGDREHKEYREYKGDKPYRERKEGDGPRPRRGEGYQGKRRGHEEYVPKQQGTTQEPTKTQTQTQQ